MKVSWLHLTWFFFQGALVMLEYNPSPNASPACLLQLTDMILSQEFLSWQTWTSRQIVMTWDFGIMTRKSPYFHTLFRFDILVFGARINILSTFFSDTEMNIYGGIRSDPESMLPDLSSCAIHCPSRLGCLTGNPSNASSRNLRVRSGMVNVVDFLLKKSTIFTISPCRSGQLEERTTTKIVTLTLTMKGTLQILLIHLTFGISLLKRRASAWRY